MPNPCAALSVRGSVIHTKVHGRKPCCEKCVIPAHDPNPCSSPARCVNCEGDMRPTLTSAPYLREREIQRIRVTEKVSFAEAKRRYLVKNPVDLRRSFSSTLANTVKRREFSLPLLLPPVATFVASIPRWTSLRRHRLCKVGK